MTKTGAPIREIDILSIFSGDPSFERTLHVGRSNIGDRNRLMERMEDMLDRKWLMNNGPFVQEFEEAVTNYLDVMT